MRWVVSVTWTQLCSLQWKGEATERRTFGRLLPFDSESDARRLILRLHNEPQRSWIPLGAFELEISEPILQPRTHTSPRTSSRYAS